MLYEVITDLERVACEQYPQIANAIDWLGAYAPARMTGSGACIFSEVGSEREAREIARQCPVGWQAWAVPSLEVHPMYGCAGPA